jgi:hypothetical protein
MFARADEYCGPDWRVRWTLNGSGDFPVEGERGSSFDRESFVSFGAAEVESGSCLHPLFDKNFVITATSQDRFIEDGTVLVIQGDSHNAAIDVGGFDINGNGI